MDSSHYQIHLMRLIPSQNIKSEFLSCNICKNILWQPEKCKNCQTHFCRFCIHFSLLKSKKCPECVQDYQSKSPDTFLIEDLMDLKIKCFFTYNGCNKILKYDQTLKHENECIYREQNCEECNKKILKKNFHTHTIMCKNNLPDNLPIDYRQILIYFKDKLDGIEKENMEDIERIKKSLMDSYGQKEVILQNLISKMQKQRAILEDIVVEKEKKMNMSEEEVKFFNNLPNYMNSNIEKKDGILIKNNDNRSYENRIGQ